MRALFDVNVLLALFDPGHIHHGAAQAWWRSHRPEGWATCPLTQNGFVRIISKPGYQRSIALSTAIAVLAAQISCHAGPDQRELGFCPQARGAYMLY